MSSQNELAPTPDPGDNGGQTCPHAICRLEYLSYLETKAIVAANLLVNILGLGGVLVLAIYKADNNSTVFTQDNKFPLINVIVICGCLVFQTSAVTLLTVQLVKTRHLQWDLFRRHMVISTLILAVVMLTMECLLITANGLALSRPCWWLVPPSKGLAVMAMLSNTCLNVVFAVMLAQVHICCPQSALFSMLGTKLWGWMTALCCCWCTPDKALKPQGALMHGIDDHKGTQLGAVEGAMASRYPSQSAGNIHDPELGAHGNIHVDVNEAGDFNIAAENDTPPVCTAANTLAESGTSNGVRVATPAKAPAPDPAAAAAPPGKGRARVRLLGKFRRLPTKGKRSSISSISGAHAFVLSDKDLKRMGLQVPGPGAQGPGGSMHSSRQLAAACDGHVANNLAAETATAVKSPSGKQSQPDELPSAYPRTTPRNLWEQLPPSVVGTKGRWYSRHVHIVTLIVIAEVMIQLGFIGALRALDQRETLGGGDWMLSASTAAQYFTQYFGEASAGVWNEMALVGAPPQPWQIDLFVNVTGAMNIVPLQLFGPNPDIAPNNTNVFWLHGAAPPDSRYQQALGEMYRPYFAQPPDVDNATFAFWVTAAYAESTLLPWVNYCSGAGMSFDEAYATIANNTAAFREHYSLPPCSEAPEQDITCTYTTCPVDPGRRAYQLVTNSIFLIYVFLYLIHILRSTVELRSYAYTNYALANMWVRLQRREGFLVLLCVLVALTTLNFVNPTLCSSHILSTLGISPVVFMLSVLLLCRAYYVAPTATHPRAMLMSERQAFAWMESDLTARKVARGSVDEPMFCYETALWCLFWTVLAYRETQDPPLLEPVFNLEHGQALDGLKAYQRIVDLKKDFAMVAAWRPGLMVLTFRGTVTLKNVLTDVKALQTKHPFMPGLVHRGFWKSWCSVRSVWRDKMAQLLMDGSCMPCNGPLRLYLTGHSLGGALASLAAVDVQQLLEELGLQEQVHVALYTFGCPRPASHRFARAFKQKIRDAWDVVNNSDVVPRATKWMRVYKRTGNRVIINTLGDCLCNPSYIEMNVFQSTRNSMEDHQLRSYRAAFAAVAVAQFSKRRSIPGGQRGVERLWASRRSSQLMEWVMGMNAEVLHEVRAALKHDAKDESPQTSLLGMLKDVANELGQAVQEGVAPVQRFGELAQGMAGFTSNQDIAANDAVSADSIPRDVEDEEL